MGYDMDKLFTFAVAIAVSLGTTAMLANSERAPQQRAAAQLNSDAAFRDGIYIGRLAVERKQPPRPLIGRWSTEKDRATFLAGYWRGYNETHFGVVSAAPFGAE
jgi:hypothetical protein